MDIKRQMYEVTVTLPLRTISATKHVFREINLTIAKKPAHECIGLFNHSELGECSNYKRVL